MIGINIIKKIEYKKNFFSIIWHISLKKNKSIYESTLSYKFPIGHVIDSFLKILELLINFRRHRIVDVFVKIFLYFRQLLSPKFFVNLEQLNQLFIVHIQRFNVETWQLRYDTYWRYLRNAIVIISAFKDPFKHSYIISIAYKKKLILAKFVQGFFFNYIH